MHPFVFYILRTIAIAGIFYGYYLLALRNKKLYNFNRIYLLASIALSLIIPLMHFEWQHISVAKESTAIKLLQAIQATGDEQISVSTGASIYTIDNMLWAAYCVVAVMILASTIRNIIKLYAVKRRSKVMRVNDADLVETQLEQAPFSFLNNIFWNADADMHSLEGSCMLRHEMVHIRQRHTLDKLFTQLTQAFFWMNPFFWLMRKELSMVHEYIADEQAIDNGDTELFARMLLQSHFGNKFSAITQPFFYSPLKNRITMLQKTSKTNYAHLRRLLVLPVVSATVLLFSFSVKEQQIDKATRKTVIVLDAGHGGMDAGGTGINGVVEKDLNLRITNEIARLAPSYNIEVVPTRKDDNIMKLEGRVEAGNNTDARLFLSIHVNKDVPGEGSHIGYEVFVSHKGAKFKESTLLASAIIGKLSSNGAATKLMDKGLVVLKTNPLPAVLIECGNIDDARDVARLQDDKQLQDMCRKILSGIVAYTNESRK